MIEVTPFAVQPPTIDEDPLVDDSTDLDSDTDISMEKEKKNKPEDIQTILPPSAVTTFSENSSVRTVRRPEIEATGETDQLVEFSILQQANNAELEAAQEDAQASVENTAIEIVHVELRRANGQVTIIPLTVIDITSLFGKLDDIVEQIQENDSIADLVAGSSLVAATGITAGYLLWIIRGGYLITMLSSTLPAWSTVDPLPVLSAAGWSAVKRRDDESDMSLSEMVST